MEIVTDESVRAMARIRRYFVEQDPTILPYLTWMTTDEPTRWVTNNSSKIRRTTQIIVALVFALLAGLVCILFIVRWTIIIGVGIISFVGVYQLLRLYAITSIKKLMRPHCWTWGFPRQDKNLSKLNLK
ncbi:MAG: hypothetical protein IPH82_29470 [Chloroflexi bacterium]|nr:hypothetical protein [Chloroflexota bacterium]